ncbi:NAD(P)H-binding protein, partial [Methylobacterium sp. E-016]|uniref:SDR family oxidoreductase n=1 Tax=Methylobacterium sp. E-016 TaxID=2836556 RepID=UPI001FB94D66
MTILITGATGRVGRNVVEQLTKRGASVRVLTRDPAKTTFNGDVEVAKGDLLDLDALRNAFTGVRTLFLLNAVTGDEFTQAIIALNAARAAGIERVVYLSVFDADRAVNV